MAIRPPSDHGGDITPLTGRTGWILVDGMAICAGCGRAVEPVGPAGWRHASSDDTARQTPEWLSPLTPDAVAEIESYQQLGERFPWVVRDDLGGPAVTSEVEWREAARRLSRYRDLLARHRSRPTLPPGENPYLDLFQDLMAPMDHPPTSTGSPSPGLTQILGLPQRRRELASLFAWAVPTDQALAAIACHAPLVECGAGMGYWAALLESRDVDVVAYDHRPPTGDPDHEFHPSGRGPWTAIRPGSSLEAARLHPDRTLVLCWPPYQDDTAGYAPVRAYRGDLVIYIGDTDGPTGSVRLHRELELNWTLIEEIALPRWPRLTDRLMVYRRNEVRRWLIGRDRCYECGRYIATGAIGRCDRCFAQRPPALALRRGEHRVEYPEEALAAMPPALRFALEASPNRLR